MKLGISSYTFGWAVGVPGHVPAHPLDETGLLTKARELGLSLVQIGDNLPLHTFDATRLARLSECAAKEGIELEPGARGLTVDRVRQYVAIARVLSARLIRFVIDDASYHPEPKAVRAILREVAPLLNDVTLAIENHDRLPAATLRDIIESSDTDRIGVCLDTANSLGAGEGIEAVCATLGPLTVNLHIKDFWIERHQHLMGFKVTGRPAGQGMLDIGKVLQYLKPFGRCHSGVLELWTPPEPAMAATITKEGTWAVESIQYLKPFFK